MSEKTKRRKCKKKYQKVYLDHSPTLWRVKKKLGRFLQGDFSLNGHPHSGLTSDVDECHLLAILEYKLRMSMEEIAKGLKMAISTDFRHLMRLGFKKTTEFGKSKRCHFLA